MDDEILLTVLLTERVSLLILNVTRTDSAKNRQSINWLIGTIQGLGSELGNIMKVMGAQLERLRMFILIITYSY